MSLPSAPRPRFGLVLSGGAVRGAAHVGVLEVLEEAGLAPDLLVGTSAGAIIGAAYAAGRPTARIAGVARRLDWFSLVGPSLHLKTALLGTRQLEALLRDDLGLTTFEALERPFCAVACDLGSGQAVTLESGDLVRAVMAGPRVLSLAGSPRPAHRERPAGGRRAAAGDRRATPLRPAGTPPRRDA